MSEFISKKGLKNSTQFLQLATAKITLSNGGVIEVTNPVEQIVNLFQFIDDPNNKSVNLGGVMINISQIVTTQWIDKRSITGTV